MLLPIAVSLLGFIFQRIKGASFSNAPPRQVIVVAGTELYKLVGLIYRLIPY